MPYTYLSQCDQIENSYYFNLFSLKRGCNDVLSSFGEIWQMYELRMKQVN